MKFGLDVHSEPLPPKFLIILFKTLDSIFLEIVLKMKKSKMKQNLGVPSSNEESKNKSKLKQGQILDFQNIEN